jgi:uncharacterized membrane protein
MKKIVLFVMGLTTLAFGIGVTLYPKLPDQMASHWNAQGVVDGTMSKPFGVFLLPLIMVFLFLLLYFLPKFDPMKENIKKFSKQYSGFIAVMVLFMFALYLQTLLWSLGTKINPVIFMPVAFAVILYYLGILIGSAEQNWTIGIRTPWTLSSKNVWDKTHQLGAKLYKIAAYITLIGLILPKFAFLFVILPLMAVSFYLVIFSFLEFKKEQGKKS